MWVALCFPLIRILIHAYTARTHKHTLPTHYDLLHASAQRIEGALERLGLGNEMEVLKSALVAYRVRLLDRGVRG